jgi:hypothetical protein
MKSIYSTNQGKLYVVQATLRDRNTVQACFSIPPAYEKWNYAADRI